MTGVQTCALPIFNTELLTTYWNIGRIIVEYEQQSQLRAEYGKQTLKELSQELTREFGKGFSVSNIQFMRRFYQSYPIQQTASVKLSWSHYCGLLTLSNENKRSFYEKDSKIFGAFVFWWFRGIIVHRQGGSKIESRFAD